MVADETSAKDAVLKSDTKRAELLEEEKKLLKESESGNTKNSERLQQVRVCKKKNYQDQKFIYPCRTVQ